MYGFYYCNVNWQFATIRMQMKVVFFFFVFFCSTFIKILINVRLYGLVQRGVKSESLCFLAHKEHVSHVVFVSQAIWVKHYSVQLQMGR